VKRLKPIIKPGGYDAATRLQYTDELAQYVEDEVILIVCDEKKFSFGGAAHGRVSAPEGDTPYVTAIRERFVREQWAAATAQDTSIPRPHVVWNADDQHDVELGNRLLDANQELKAHIEGQRVLAERDPTSNEAKLLHDKNEEVRLYNEEQQRQRKRGRKRYFTAERLFKYQAFTGTATALDFIWYAFRIYQDLLFPYIQQLRASNPGKRVVIIEDNSPVHLKARKLVAPLINRLSIEFASHPANSPDLNPIETLHREEDKPIYQFRLNTYSAAASVKQQCDEKLKEIWQSKEFDQFVTKYCSYEAFQSLLKKVREANGHNNFKDQ
jgi:transposase